MHSEYMRSFFGEKSVVQRRGVTFLILSLAVCSCLVAVGLAAQPMKEVNSEADLPRTIFSTSGPISSLLQSDDTVFAPMLQKAIADIHSLLTDYDIKDRATLISVLSAKLATQELSGETDEALQTIGTLRALQQKPDLKLTTGLFDEAILKAQQTTNATFGPAYEHAIDSTYKEAVSALPWDTVQDTIKSARNTSGLLTEAFLLGRAQEALQPEVDKSGGLDRQSFYKLLDYRVAIRLKLPANAIRSAVLEAYVAAHDTQKPDIWPARNVTLSEADHLAEVRIGILDSGVDTGLYPNQLFSHPHSEPYPAQGLAFTDEGYASDATLEPLSPDQRKVLVDDQARSRD